MHRQDQPRTIRSVYAKQILAAARLVNPKLDAAFGVIRSAEFLVAGPDPEADHEGRINRPSAQLRPEKLSHNIAGTA